MNGPAIPREGLGGGKVVGREGLRAVSKIEERNKS